MRDNGGFFGFSEALRLRPGLCEGRLDWQQPGFADLPRLIQVPPGISEGRYDWQGPGFYGFPLIPPAMLHSPTPIRARNVSSADAQMGDVGLISYDATYGVSYNMTTTANKVGAWCVVVTGGSSGRDIYVARRGVVPVRVNGAAAVGNFLTTSSTAGLASANTSMRAEMFAIVTAANDGYAGSRCLAQLYTLTVPWSLTSPVDLYRHDNVSTQAFTSTINGTPGSGSFVYGTVLTGSANVLVPSAAGQIGLIRIWNTTRGTFRLITAVNTGTKTVSNVTASDAWANGDTITVESQTIQTSIARKYSDLDFSNANNTVIDPLARGLWVNLQLSDTGGVGGLADCYIHPFQSYVASQQMYVNTQANSTLNIGNAPIALISNVIGICDDTSGVGTGFFLWRLAGYDLAVS